MKKDIAVFGIGAFGEAMALQLYKLGNNVLAVDHDPKIVERIKDDVTEAIVADVTDEDVISELSVAKFDLIILTMGNDLESLILCTTHLKNAKVKKIMAKVNSAIQKQILASVGADEVIEPEKEFAELLAKKITAPNIMEIVPFDNGFLATVAIPARMYGKTLQELDLRHKYKISAILIKKNNDEAGIIWDPSIKLETGDELTVIGMEDNITAVFGEK